MSSELYQRGFKSSIFEYAGIALGAVLQIITMVFVVRFLTVSELGYYNLLTGSIGVFSLLLSFGLLSVLIRFVPEYWEKKNFLMIGWLVKKALAIRLIAGIALAVLLCWLATPIATLLNAPALAQYIPMLSVCMLFILESEVLLVTLNSLLLQKYKQFAKITFFIARFALYYVLLKAGYGIPGVIIALITSNALLLFLYYIKIRKEVFVKKKIGTRIKGVTQFIRYGLPFYFSWLGAGLVNTSTDLYLISFFIGTTATGLYGFATGTTFTLLGWLPITAVAGIVLPVVIRRYTKTKDQNILKSGFSLHTRITAFCVFPLIAGMLVLSDKIILHIFKAEYLDAQGVLCLMFVCVGLFYFQTPVKVVYEALKQSRIALYSKIFLVYNLATDIILIPMIGIIGAAIATGSALLFMLAFEFWMTNKLIKLKVPWKSLTKCAVNSAAMGAVVFFARPFVTELISLLAVVAVGGIIYFALSVVNKTFADKDRELFRKASGHELPF